VSVSLPDALDERLDALVAEAQAEQRIPSVSAAVFRDGDVLWRRALGLADVEREGDATPEHAWGDADAALARGAPRGARGRGARPPAGRGVHYSNLAFGLLGEVVARRSERGYEDALATRVLEPLGLSRTSFDPTATRPTGYFVDPSSDR
jgi:CubicO group peptidase (beta-lactamase class C family)